MKILTKLQDALDFSNRHDLDTEIILKLVLEPTQSKKEAREAKSQSKNQSKSQSIDEKPSNESTRRHELPLSRAEELHVVKQWWLEHPDDFLATGLQAYEANGFTMPYRSRRFTNWLLLSPEAGAVFAGIEDHRYLFRRDRSAATQPNIPNKTIPKIRQINHR